MYNPGDPSPEQYPTEYFHHQQEEFYLPNIQAPALLQGHQVQPSIGFSAQTNYDFAYCETQWMYYDSQQCSQYGAYCYRQAYAFSHMQVKERLGKILHFNLKLTLFVHGWLGLLNVVC